MSDRVFLLSPANASGKRGQMLLAPSAAFPLAVRFREQGAPIGEVYSFISGLYFRGKLTYARRFGPASTFVIVAGRGLLAPDTSISHQEYAEIASIPVDAAEPRFRDPLVAAASALTAAEAVLLGSIATPKYFDPLVSVFGPRLMFPREFAGRGDMSRGGLMLRHAESGQELEYVCAIDAVRKGPRPPKLPSRSGI